MIAFAALPFVLAAFWAGVVFARLRGLRDARSTEADRLAAYVAQVRS